MVCVYVCVSMMSVFLYISVWTCSTYKKHIIIHIIILTIWIKKKIVDVVYWLYTLYVYIHTYMFIFGWIEQYSCRLNIIVLTICLYQSGCRSAFSTTKQKNNFWNNKCSDRSIEVLFPALLGNDGRPPNQKKWPNDRPANHGSYTSNKNEDSVKVDTEIIGCIQPWRIR